MDNFRALSQQLHPLAPALDPVRLHGMVTALAVSPWDSDFNKVLGGIIDPALVHADTSSIQALLIEATADANEAMLEAQWRPLLDEGKESEQISVWLEGFNEVIDGAAGLWAPYEDHSPLVKFYLALLKSLADKETAESLFLVPADGFDDHVA
ncbi:MAG: hypothetical protein ABFS23_14550, partial [Pseudomonadota bacterium]